MAFFFKFRYSLFLSCFYDRIRERKGWDLDMQRESIRMYAYAIDFDLIKVDLSLNYYNGISSQYYLKNLDTSEVKILKGEATEKENGFQSYLLHTDFSVGTRYKVFDNYGLACFLDFSQLSMSKDFDDHFYYDGDDLGSHYTKEKTTFKVWSPLSTEVVLKIWKDEDLHYYPLERGDKGVYSTTIKKDLDGYEYVYIIGMNEQSIETADPYAYSCTANMHSSVVIDLDKVRRVDYPLTELKHNTDAVIYEVGVRDFSVDEYGQITHKGEFLGFCEEGTVTKNGFSSGMDYLDMLGVTHVQLLPINDYATVDEDHPDLLYNWGYDPAQYNVPEGSYITDPNDGYKRILDCQRMVRCIHKHNMRVILDVVYNHMHDVNNNTLEKTVPYYFFRRDENGELSNGSWCGNDLNTTAKMCRKYILDMCKRWQVLYGVDGFRMDLMGIVDNDTVNMIYEQGHALDSSFMLYGEGWNMGTALPDSEKTTIENNHKTPHVGFFNDHFRDTVKGPNQMEVKGYTSGDTYKTNEAIIAMCDYNKFLSIEQSINYTECHDNATVFDKFIISNGHEDEYCRQKRCLLTLAMTILAQGVPFIHAGQEFLGTKNGNQNSYNAGDAVNKLDWERHDEYMNVVQAVKFFIDLRKHNKCFRYYDYEDMHQHVFINNIYYRMVEYHLTQDEGDYKEFKIYFNPSYDVITIGIEDDFKILYSMSNERIENGQLNVFGVSMVVCAR